MATVSLEIFVKHTTIICYLYSVTKNQPLPVYFKVTTKLIQSLFFPKYNDMHVNICIPYAYCNLIKVFATYWQLYAYVTDMTALAENCMPDQEKSINML